MVHIHELRKMDKKKLIEECARLDKEIALEVFDVQTQRSKKTAQLRAKKKDLARMKTVITELTLLEK